MIDEKKLNTKYFPSWCPGCLLPGELVHTDSDIKAIEEVKKGDLVLTHSAEVHEVTETFKHQHKDHVYQITVKCFGEMRLTPEHPLLVVRRAKKKRNNKDYPADWVRADEVRVSDYVVFPIPQEVNDLKTIPLNRVKSYKDTRSRDIPARIKLDAEVLFLFGLYIAEGWVHGRAVNFAFHIDEEELQNSVRQIVKRVFGLETTFKLFPEKHLVEMYVNHSVLARQFSVWFGTGAQKKKIPEFLMTLPIRMQGNLIRGLWAGDGYINANADKGSYKTISPSLAQQVKVLLLRQGIVPTISINKAYSNHKESYSVQVVSGIDFKLLTRILGIKRKFKVGTGTKTPIVRNEKFVYLPIRKIEKRKYSGPVYNLEVDKDNSFVMAAGAVHNCGDFGIWAALKKAIANLDIPKERLVIAYGIGCHGNMASFMNVYGIHGLHGRAVPVAEGIKLANSKLKVIVVGGDGDLLGEGMNHIISAARSNPDITVILHNNQVYGLTTGQSSPTSLKGSVSKTYPNGVPDEPINPIQLMLTLGASHVARGFAGDIEHLTGLIDGALKHRGFSLVDILQPCVTYNKLNTYAWFRQRLKKLERPETSRLEALKKAVWSNEQILIGDFFAEEKPTFNDAYPQLTQKTTLQLQRIKSLEEMFGRHR